MNPKATALLTAVALGSAVTAGYAADAARELATLSHARVSMNQAITVAEEQGSGQAIDAQYIPKDDAMGMYDVKVLSMDGKKLLNFNITTQPGLTDVLLLVLVVVVVSLQPRERGDTEVFAFTGCGALPPRTCRTSRCARCMRRAASYGCWSWTRTTAARPTR